MLFGLLFISMYVHSQKVNFKIVSTTSDSVNKVFLTNYNKQDYYKNEKILDSAIIADGFFSFNIIKTTKTPFPYYLKFNDEIISERFFIEKTNSNFVIDSLYLRVAPKPIEFSQSNLENIEFEKKYNNIKIEFYSKNIN